MLHIILYGLPSKWICQDYAIAVILCPAISPNILVHNTFSDRAGVVARVFDFAETYSEMFGASESVDVFDECSGYSRFDPMCVYATLADVS